MNFNKQMNLLVIGAIIALISSLTTIIVNTIVNEWVSKHTKKTAKLEKLYYLTGRLSALGKDDPEDIGEKQAQEIPGLKDVIEAAKRNEILLDSTIGSLEAWLENKEK
jgi:fructose 1,6-bisphosphatase